MIMDRVLDVTRRGRNLNMPNVHSETYMHDVPLAKQPYLCPTDELITYSQLTTYHGYGNTPGTTPFVVNHNRLSVGHDLGNGTDRYSEVSSNLRSDYLPPPSIDDGNGRICVGPYGSDIGRQMVDIPPLTAQESVNIMRPMPVQGASIHQITQRPMMGDYMRFQSTIKQPFSFESLTLTPPDSSTELLHRERPPCCRTVFIAGLPENATAQHLQEVFSHCGAIHSIRVNKKRYAHIRFEYEDAVDLALYLSGYRMILHVNGCTDETMANTGRIFIDYADDRDDKYAAECIQRQVARERRHHERMMRELAKSPSPPPMLTYSNLNMNELIENVKQGNNLEEPLRVVISWLERGDCNKKSVNSFYSLMQTANVQIRRLHNEKTTMQTELNAQKDKFQATFETIVQQMARVDELYTSAAKQKAWDNFTKAQRKNIQLWQKQVQGSYHMLQEEYGKLYITAEDMDLSDDNDDSESQPPRFDTQEVGQLQELKNEKSSLIHQLDEYKNEVEVLKQDVKRLEIEKEQLTKTAEEECVTSNQPSSSNNDENMTINQPNKLGEHQSLVDHHVHIIGMVCCFLNVHPNGATIDYIWSYINEMNVTISCRDLEDILHRFSKLFSQHCHGIGANLERRWYLQLFSNKSNSTSSNLQS